MKRTFASWFILSLLSIFPAVAGNNEVLHKFIMQKSYDTVILSRAYENSTKCKKNARVLQQAFGKSKNWICIRITDVDNQQQARSLYMDLGGAVIEIKHHLLSECNSNARKIKQYFKSLNLNEEANSASYDFTCKVVWND